MDLFLFESPNGSTFDFVGRKNYRSARWSADHLKVENPAEAPA
jgi:hypothetical protein